MPILLLNPYLGAGNASGQPLPTDNVTGWDLTLADDFATPFSTGGVNSSGVFPSPYATTFSAYADGTADTTKNTQGSNSVYHPSTVLSCANSKLIKSLYVTGGQARSAAVIPMPGGVWGQQYGRFEACFRVASVTGGWKVAWLLWPNSEDWPTDGEIDYPEGNLALTGPGLNVLPQGAATGAGSEFDHHYINGTTFDVGNWHVYTLEWASTHVAAWLDGRLVGATYDTIPNTPMHWVLQTETEFAAYPTLYPGSSDTGVLEVDWVAVWDDDTPPVPGAGSAPSSTQTFSEAFTGSNGAAWSGSNWSSTTTTSGATAQIQTNRGRLTTGTVGGYADHVLRLSTTALDADNHKINTTIRLTSVTECYPYLPFRRVDANNGYLLVFQASLNAIVLTRQDGGASTDIAKYPWTFSSNLELDVEILTVADATYIRVSTAGSGRPTNPIIGTDTSAHAGTGAGLGLFGGNAASARTVEFDNYSIATVP